MQTLQSTRSIQFLKEYHKIISKPSKKVENENMSHILTMIANYMN